MKIKATIVVVLAALLLVGGFLVNAWAPVSAAGMTYFVSDAGDDNNDGKSVESPWKSLSKVNETLLQPGDSVNFRRGDVWTGILVASQSGTAKSGITLGSYGSGSLPTIVAGQDGICVRIDGDYVTVDSLQAEACGYAGFSVSGDHNVIRNSAATQNAAGIKVGEGSDFGSYANNTLTDNNVMNVNTPGTACGTAEEIQCNDDSGAFGILINGSDNEFSGNTITGSTASSYDFSHDGSAFEIFNGSRNNIHHNTAVDNNVFSEIGRSKGSAADGNTYRYNLIRATCGENCSQASGLIARGPTSSFGPTNNTTFEYNTVWLDGPESQAVVCHASCPASTKIRGNILVAVQNALWIDGSGWTEQQNVLNGPTNVRPDSTSTTEPAGFVNAPTDLHLTSSSPAIDRAGTSPATADLDGQPVDRNGDCTGDGAADAGAYEYRPGNC
jgi:hypothetical protein